MEFVDDIADPNIGYFEALKSNQTISSIQKRKRFAFSAEKCKILKINSTDNSNSLFCQVSKLRLIYLSDIFSNKGNNSSLREDRAQKAKGSSNKLFHYARSQI